MQLPPKSHLVIYDGRGNIIQSSRERIFDLADELMLAWPKKSRSVGIGIATKSLRWQMWSEESVVEFERRIRDDLSFDGYSVNTIRRTVESCPPCSTEFRWMLLIRTR